MALTKASQYVINDVANTSISGLITSGQIASVANTQVTGVLTDSQLASVLDLTSKTVTLDVIENVYAISGSTPAISGANGGIQTWTLPTSSTPTDSMANGESVTLMIDDGAAQTVTWTSLVDQWVGGSAPTLATSGYTVVELWKQNNTVYAAYVGDLS